MHVASCSFGKDSIATILLALEHGEPLDEAVFVEVMFDHARNISGEIPEHIGWIYDTAIPRLEAMGVRTRVLRSERDYMYLFTNAVGGGTIRRQTLRLSDSREMLSQQWLQVIPDTAILAEPRRGSHPVYRNRRRRAEEACKAAKRKRQTLQGLPAREVRLHGGDDEGSLRKARTAIANL